MWKVIINEWKYLQSTRVLLILSLAFLGVLMLSVWLGNRQTKTQIETYKNAKEHVRKKWESIKEMNPHGAAHYGSYVFKPSNLLNGLDGGVNGITGNILKVEGHVQNEITHSEASQMQTISKFGKLSSSLLLQYILPILLIFLSFHSVSSELQSGRFKLMVLQGAKPFQVVFAKMLAVWFYSIFLLTITILVYILLNIKSLNPEILARISLFFISYVLYYFIICGLTTLFSARWKNATLALTSMLGIWIMWSIFLPNILMSSVEKWNELPSRNTFKSAMSEDRSKGIDGHNPREGRRKELEEQILKEYKVDSLSQLPVNISGILMQADEEYGNKVWDKHFGELREVMIVQKQNYQLGGVINPFISLQNASMGFAGSDNLHHQDFLIQAENYRRVFIKMLNDEYAFGESQKAGGSGMADNTFFKSVPNFKFQPIKIASVLSSYTLDILLLLLWGGFTLILLWNSSKKMKLT